MRESGKGSEVKGARFTPSSELFFHFFPDSTLKLGQASEGRARSGLLGRHIGLQSDGVYMCRDGDNYMTFKCISVKSALTQDPMKTGMLLTGMVLSTNISV